MKIKVQEEFNIFELFVQDNEAIHAVDAYALAESLNEHLDEIGYKVIPPEGLDRFTLFNANDEEESYIERYYSVQQVKNELPDEVVDQLKSIDEMQLDLSPRLIRED